MSGAWGHVELAADGQANTCPHGSATGIDTQPIGPGKIWRCDHCGLRWTDLPARMSETRDREHIINLKRQDAVRMATFIQRPNGSLQLDSRLVIEAVEGGGIWIRTRPYQIGTGATK